jgi:hypothetical protein
VSPGGDMSVDTRNGSVTAPSTVESKALSNAEFSARSGLKCQLCTLTFPSFLMARNPLPILLSHYPTHERRDQSNHASLPFI